MPNQTSVCELSRLQVRDVGHCVDVGVGGRVVTKMQVLGPLGPPDTVSNGVAYLLPMGVKEAKHVVIVVIGG